MTDGHTDGHYRLGLCLLSQFNEVRTLWLYCRESALKLSIKWFLKDCFWFVLLVYNEKFTFYQNKAFLFKDSKLICKPCFLQNLIWTFLIKTTYNLTINFWQIWDNVSSMAHISKILYFILSYEIVTFCKVYFLCCNQQFKDFIRKNVVNNQD